MLAQELAVSIYVKIKIVEIMSYSPNQTHLFCHALFSLLTLVGRVLSFFIITYSSVQWKRINCKHSDRWQHLSQLEASAFFSLQ
jgi:hypothetical protein